MRFTMALTTAAAALLAALAVALGAGAGVAGAATGASSAPSWSTLQAYSSATASGSSSTLASAFTEVISVACPAYGKCVAAGVEVGPGDEENAVIALETSPGQWGPSVAAPIPGNGSGAGALFTSVACSSATSCVAVGTYDTGSNGGQAFADPFTISGSTVAFGTSEQVALPSGAVTSGSQGAFLSGVSCGAGGCVGVGSYNATSGGWTAMTATSGAGGTWTGSAVSAPAGASEDSGLTAISCPSSGVCEAVGNYGDGSNHLQLWAVQVNNGVAGTDQSVTIPGAVASNATTPSADAFLNLRDGLAAVSCPSAGVCTAAATVEATGGVAEAALVPINAGTPGQPSPLSSNSPDAEAELEAISCSDASDCTTTGLEIQPAGMTAVAIAATETGGTWSAPVTLQGSDTSTLVPLSIAIGSTIACTSPGVCVIAGLKYTASGSGSTATITEASFFAYSAPALTLTTSSLPAAVVGTPYTATLQSSGGAGTGSWAVSPGSLPAGLTLNPATGVISGTPKTAGQNGFIATITDAGPPSLASTASLSITVGPVASVSLAYSKISGHSALIVLSCSNAACIGKFKLTGVEHLHGKTPTAVDAKAKKRPKTRTVTLASGRYSIKAGDGKAITIKLNGTGRKLLRELHRISGRLALTPAGAKKPALMKSLKFRS
jgi:hypothetical protein